MQLGTQKAGRVVRVGWFALVLVLVGLVGQPAVAFTIDDVLTNGTDDPSDDLLDAARWSNTTDSLVERGVRGLGGGLEYAFTSDFCTRLVPRFDNPLPTCADLRRAVQRAFDRWAAGHPFLRFVDVSGRIGPALGSGAGAEIDLLALSPAEFPRMRNLGSYAEFWFVRMNPFGTNGQQLPGNTLTASDIILNTESCFTINPAGSPRCNHFESLILHEIGHALALDHPNEFRHRNFDTDDNPTNPIRVDCSRPSAGLRLSRAIDPRAVMNSSMGRPEPVHTGLTNDDLGGRDFLYPICPAGKSPELTLALWANWVWEALLLRRPRVEEVKS